MSSDQIMSSDSEFEADPIKNGDLFQQILDKKTQHKKTQDKKTQDKKKAEKGQKDSSSRSKAAKPEDSKAKSAKDWTDDEISLLIDLLESNTCLWHHKDYSKRDLKEIAHSNIAESFDTNIASIKTKINSLRTQFGKELTKERRTKSGQSTDELYSSNWIHFDKLAFLTQVFWASKSRDTVKRMSKNDQMTHTDDCCQQVRTSLTT